MNKFKIGDRIITKVHFKKENGSLVKPISDCPGCVTGFYVNDYNINDYNEVSYYIKYDYSDKIEIEDEYLLTLDVQRQRDDLLKELLDE